MESTNHLSEKQENDSRKRKGVAGAQKKLDAEAVKLLQQIKKKANEKSFGRKVLDREIISMGLKMIGSDQIRQLQEQTYNAKDRLHIAHELFCRENSRITLDEFIGRLMSRQIDVSQKP